MAWQQLSQRFHLRQLFASFFASSICAKARWRFTLLCWLQRLECDYYKELICNAPDSGKTVLIEQCKVLHKAWYHCCFQHHTYQGGPGMAYRFQHLLWSLWDACYAIWTLQCTSNLPSPYQQYIMPVPWHLLHGIYWWYSHLFWWFAEPPWPCLRSSASLEGSWPPLRSQEVQIWSYWSCVLRYDHVNLWRTDGPKEGQVYRRLADSQ